MRKQNNKNQKKKQRKSEISQIFSKVPVIGYNNIGYEKSEKIQATNYGGVGLVVELLELTRLPELINENVGLIHQPKPYYDSDHVFSMVCNIITGGQTLFEINQKRLDAAFLKALGANRLPHSTTAGDYLARFEIADDALRLMESINEGRKKVWNKLPATSSGKKFERANIDIDGTIAATWAECKQGIGFSYKGIWGYAPLLFSLANTRELLFIVNRPGNARYSCDDSHWADKAVELVRPYSERVCLRGDSEFPLTRRFDEWTEKGIEFVFCYRSCKSLLEMADDLPEEAWAKLKRKTPEPTSATRAKPENVKEKIVREKQYKNLKLLEEHVSEFEYQPTCCKKAYRMVVLRKKIQVSEVRDGLFGEEVEIRYFFYITNRIDLIAEEVVFESNKRCNQENLIEQMKNGVNAMKMPTSNLYSNWAYMIIASLAWNFKTWLALLTPENLKGPDGCKARQKLLRMEYRQFFHSFILLPCQIVKKGRKLVFRLLAENSWSAVFLELFNKLRKLKFS